MLKLDYPARLIQVTVGDKVFLLRELTAGFTLQVAKDPDFDTPLNALMDAGLTEDDVNELPHRVMVDLYKQVIKLTYGDGTEESETDAEETKKN